MFSEIWGSDEYKGVHSNLEMAKFSANNDRLSRLLEQCELLPERLNTRQTVLEEMRSLGGQIDAAYASFAASPRTPADKESLRQTQTEIQARIEKLRIEADDMMTDWWALHRSAGDELVEAARQTPALLSAVDDFRQLPLPSDSCPQLQVLRLRELLTTAMSLLVPAGPAVPDRESQSEQRIGGLLTAQDIAAALGISDKTIYRLVKEGRIPYVRIHSSLRFRQADIDTWLTAKSFEPAGMRKTRIGKTPISRAPSD
jgi:excisionase family DNA binding protein